MKKLLPYLTILLCLSATAQITQPTQPSSGPGGSSYTFGGVTQYDYGTNGSGSDFWLYEPNTPTPDSANVIVFIHGLGETNPKLYGAFIKHLVRKGNIVIYPRYQKDLNASNTTFNDSCAKGILRALDTLQLPNHVKPRLENYFVLGHSVGGVLTANMTMLHQQYGLPKPLTAFSMQPGAASFLMSDYSAFPSDVKYLVAVGVDDIIVGTAPGTTLYNQTVNVPTSHKNLITQSKDSHGTPAMEATHFAPLAGDVAFDNGETNLFIAASGSGPVDGVDFFLFWKLQDALMDCALNNQNCEYAFGDTPEQHGMGNWSDGVPAKILDVLPKALNAIDEISSEVSVSVFPNPAVNSYELRVLNYGAMQPLKFELYDTRGALLEQVNFQTASLSLQTNDLANGIYFYQINNNSGNLVGKGKIVINNAQK
jgi:poly(3-hydroxybutyrate) depolymerase